MNLPAIIVCPVCRHEFAGAATVRWGHGSQRASVAPFVCEHCAAASVINLVTGEVYAMPEEGWAWVRAHNPTLSAKIDAVQRSVLLRAPCRSYRRGPVS